MSMNSAERFQWHGYRPGVLGLITRLHAVYYHEQWGFDLSFETQVGRELCEFMSRFDPATDVLWTVFDGDEFVGAVVIDGRPPTGEGARLRWFIVDERYQGSGLGRALIRKGLEFCRSVGHTRVFLWTFQGLEAARILYETEGFRLVAEHAIEQWGSQILEQKYERTE
jgi:GNAT superfamily N-acetyltransferase